MRGPLEIGEFTLYRSPVGVEQRPRWFRSKRAAWRSYARHLVWASPCTPGYFDEPMAVVEPTSDPELGALVFEDQCVIDNEGIPRDPCRARDAIAALVAQRDRLEGEIECGGPSGRHEACRRHQRILWAPAIEWLSRELEATDGMIDVGILRIALIGIDGRFVSMDEILEYVGGLR